MSVEALFDEGAVRTRAHLAALNKLSWQGSDFTYVIWDLQPEQGWLPQDHHARQVLASDRLRPLYAGKAANWGSVARHLTKDGIGCGQSTPTNKNAVNEGLLAYCLCKPTSGWLGMSVQPHASQQAAQRDEQEAVSHLGWRRDVKERKLLNASEVTAAAKAGPEAWRQLLGRLKELHRSLVCGSLPAHEGVLLNQTDPTHDARGIIQATSQEVDDAGDGACH